MLNTEERLARLELAVALLIDLNELDVIAQIPMAVPDKFAKAAAELLKIRAELGFKKAA